MTKDEKLLIGLAVGFILGRAVSQTSKPTHGGAPLVPVSKKGDVPPWVKNIWYGEKKQAPTSRVGTYSKPVVIMKRRT